LMFGRKSLWRRQRGSLTELAGKTKPLQAILSTAASFPNAELLFPAFL
jgi:hypothetical protein